MELTEQQERILRDFDALDEPRQQLLADLAASLLDVQERDAS
jgi:hypothetical protein